MGGDKMNCNKMNFDKHNNFDNIPKELRELDRWVCWRWEAKFKKDGTPDEPAKMPINPSTGGRAMSNNPATWGTFQDAVEAADKGKIKDIDVLGIGFMFNGDGIIGVDIDHCRENEVLTDQARDIISTLDSYTEFSQSGNGVHIICYGKLPEGGRRKSCVEMYSTGRYFIVTGYTLDDAHMSIEERTEELAAVHEKYINVKKTGKNEQKSIKNEQNIPFFQSDDEIIEKASAAADGTKFQALLNGVTSLHDNDDSRADMSLCNMLAFWTNKDPAQIDRIFRMSGLYRSKWDEKRPGGTYGSNTIKEAIAECRNTYNPGYRADTNKQPPDIDSGLDQLAASVVEKPLDDTSSDMGRSRVFSLQHKGKILWCAQMKCWLIWNQKQWKSDEVLEIVNMAKDTVSEMIKAAGIEVINATGEDQVKIAKQKFKDTIKGKSEKSIKSMLDLAKSDLPVIASELDQDVFLLNCQNGIVDLKTKKLLPHNPDYKMSKIAKANFLPEKKMNLFGEFLKDITCGDDEMADYFQQVCGMAAIGKVFHEGMCIFYGGGRNGKTTFLNCISEVFGDYSCTIDADALMAQRDGKQMSNGAISVEGKRFAWAEESEEGKRLSSAVLKKLSSTAPILEKMMYQNQRSFKPSHTLILATNHLPKVGSTDTGTWRRIAVVPFKAVFEGKKEIKDYASVLFAEDGDAILSWIVEGASKYIANGCNVVSPKIVKAATEQYKNSEDWISNFIFECCETGEYEETGGNLFESYKNWCAANNESYVRRSRDFADELTLKGFEKKHTKGGSVWSGLRLIENSNTASFSKYKSVRYKQEPIQSSTLDGLDDDGLDRFARSKL